MTIVKKIEIALETLGGVASLNDIYKAFKMIDFNTNNIPNSSIRARIYENCKVLDAYKGNDLFGSVYGRGEGIFSLKSFFKSEDDAKFVFELKEERINFWNKFNKKKQKNNKVFISNKLYKKLGIHNGERGVYRDLKKTRKNNFIDGFTLSVLNTGKIYNDLISENHLLYHYPTTSQRTTDTGEINSLKNADKYNLPIFIILSLENKSNLKEIKFGNVKKCNDNQKMVLIEFSKNKKIILSTKYDELEENNEDEDALPLFDKTRLKKKNNSNTRGNNQPKFRSDVFNYYKNRCAVCDLDMFLDAAHIIPIEKKGVDHKKNGLILCKNHHKAFDDNFFKINPETLKIDFLIGQHDLRINKINIKHLENKPAKKYLEWRYRNY